MQQGLWSDVRWHLQRLLPSDDPVLNYHYGRLLVLGIGGQQDYQAGASHLLKAIDLPEGSRKTCLRAAPIIAAAASSSDVLVQSRKR